MIKKIQFTLIIALAIVLTGCASLKSQKSPTANLNTLKSFYVQKLPADGRGIERIISDQLNLLGYKSTYGDTSKPSNTVDAIVTYQDRWMWDITMYMLRLNIQIRDGETSMVLASGESYRPSLQRKSPDEMVREVLSKILDK